jgi:hypothetical protein
VRERPLRICFPQEKAQPKIFRRREQRKSLRMVSQESLDARPAREPSVEARHSKEPTQKRYSAWPAAVSLA